MKVALVHDYIKEYGGAERVLETLHEIWPEAPVYTSVYLPEFLGPHRERFEGRFGRVGKLGGAWDIRTSFLQYLPFKAKLISPIRLIAPLVFKTFDFSEFDVVIVSATGAYTPNAIKIRNPKSEIRNKSQNTKYKIQNTIHVCYCHTPPRYLYGYATARNWKKNVLFRAVGEVANHFLRLIDFKSAQNVDYFIANSQEVQSRIKKFYRKNSTVIYPPVELNAAGLPHVDAKINTDLKRINTDKDLRKFVGNPCKSYYLTGGRLARAKHTDLIIEACQKLGVQLKVFGRGFGGNEISNLQSPISNFQSNYSKDFHSGEERSDDSRIDSGQARMTVGNKDSNIEYFGEVTDEEKMELMKNAKAFIFAGEDEDFGITPVEAMSVGTPVIAYKSGGVKETVVDGKTGVFFDKLTMESISKAIKHYDDTYHHSGFKREDCINQAKKFSKERFKKEIEKFVESSFS